ncbi:MAG: hypothetical protein AAFX85_03030 [Pseudomonadota bacterium]
MLLLTGIIALLLDLTYLTVRYEWVDAPQWMLDETPQVITTLAKVAALAWWARSRGLLLQWRALRRLLGALVLMAAVPLVELLASGDGAVGDFFGRGVNQTMLLAVLGLIVSLAWFLAGVEIIGSEQTPWCGYRDLVITATWLIALATVLFFFRSLWVLGHVVFDLSVLGVAIASRRPAMSLGRRGRGVIYLVTIAVLSFVYVVPVLFWGGRALFDFASTWIGASEGSGAASNR